MSPLRHALVDYLAVRRALGFKLQRAEKLLDQFLMYVEQCGETHLRVPTMLAWATAPGQEQSGWPAYRLGIVRHFALHLHAIDPVTEVQPPTCCQYDTAAPRRTCTPTRRWPAC